MTVIAVTAVTGSPKVGSLPAKATPLFEAETLENRKWGHFFEM